MSNCSSDWHQGSPARSRVDNDQMHSTGWITSILFPLLVLSTDFWSDSDFTVEILTCALKKYFNEAFPPSNVPLAMSVPPYLLCFTVQVLGFMWGIRHHGSPTSAGRFPLEGTSLPQTKGGQTRVIQTVVMLMGIRLWCENKSKLLWEDKNPAWYARVGSEGDGRCLRRLRGAERFLLTIMNEQLRWEDLERPSGLTFCSKGTPYYLVPHAITSWKLHQWGVYPTPGEAALIFTVIPTAWWSSQVLFFTASLYA